MYKRQLEDISSASDPYAALDKVRGEINDSIKTISGQTSSCINEQKFDDAREQVRRWQFLEKLSEEANSIEARLDDD